MQKRLSRALASAARDAAMVSAIENGGRVSDCRDGTATREQMAGEHAAVRKAAERIDFSKT